MGQRSLVCGHTVPRWHLANRGAHPLVNNTELPPLRKKRRVLCL